MRLIVGGGKGGVLLTEFDRSRLEDRVLDKKEPEDFVEVGVSLTILRPFETKVRK